MTTSFDTNSRPTSALRLIVLGAVTVALLAAIALGGNYLWQLRFGQTRASAADCQLAQQLFDQGENAPSEPAEAEQWEQDIRKIRYADFVDQGISTEVGRFIYWSRVKATGEGERPTPAEITLMRENAEGHCAHSGVELTIPELAF
ncbi:hypothetical protein [Micromonospora sp. NBC_01813]|uniref:hypothetical protein n=1 Tax=Micromonospora sp. NBC_01813 TaxID=2975988 RepID=UPI002DDBD296|nr:hypothetical protein [Micromonospora sp. NBC_01813]WSA08907.1 hypothetical protein OG958_32925 [Micromonospora sp. NBC_01813]